MVNKVIKFFQITGLCSKKNDLLLFCKNKLSAVNKLAIYFHGDLQNYEEEMLKFNCTKEYVEWNLENTIKLIGDKYPDYAILSIKCSEISMNRFARFKNFIDYEDELVKYKQDFDCLQHLEQLIQNLKREIELNSDYQEVNFKVDNINEIICVGFSSGCTILNQIMISLNELKIELDNAAKRKEQNSTENLSTDDGLSNDFLSCSMSNSINFNSNFNLTNSLSTSFTDNKIFFQILNDEVNKRLKDFYDKLKKLIFLDLGCNVVNEQVYILDEQILQSVLDLNIEFEVHCTPYQINCSYRPHIGEQEKEFGQKLTKLNANYHRKVYFENCSRSIHNHFKLLKEFETF